MIAYACIYDCNHTAQDILGSQLDYSLKDVETLSITCWIRMPRQLALASTGRVGCHNISVMQPMTAFAQGAPWTDWACQNLRNYVLDSAVFHS